MGNCCLPIRLRRTSSAVNPKNVTLLLVGLDKSGKTTIAKRLTGEPVDSVVPTVGFSVVTIRQKGCRVSVYDLGGGPQIRDIWHRYYGDAHGVIFVVDAVAADRMDECRRVLENLLESEQISGKPVLLLANKQDLDGALDEIDVVDSLNLEKLVNEQKCPTLVELCSALHSSKKIDAGIDNGYKWLIRGIIKDYPSLNNRVLKDLAKQEEENKVRFLRRPKDEGRDQDDAGTVGNHVDTRDNPFKPVRKVLEEKEKNHHVNGDIPTKRRTDDIGPIPGLVDEHQEKENRVKVHRFLDEETVTEEETRVTSYSSEFFLIEKFQSDVELLNDVPNQTFKNFLVRPKSSGARLYGVRPDKRKARRRRNFTRGNKTGPSPFTDLTNEQQRPRMPQGVQSRDEGSIESTGGQVRPGSRRRGNAFARNSDPFVVTDRDDPDDRYDELEMRPTRAKTGPGSRVGSGSGSGTQAGSRRVSATKSDGRSSSSSAAAGAGERTNQSSGVVLDVRQLGR